MQTFTIDFYAGPYNGRRTVEAEDGDHAIAKVKAWVHREFTPPMYAEGYKVVRP